MASTNFTTHYSIPLPLGTDLTTPMDYNEAAEDIDTALFGAVTDAGNASEAASEAVNTANTASAAVDAIGADLAIEKAKIVQLQTRMTAAENDIDDVYTDVTDMITAYKEPSATSTHAYAIGDYFIYNETLYKATAAITVGATIVPNTNCETTNVSSELKQINNDKANKPVRADAPFNSNLDGRSYYNHLTKIGDEVFFEAEFSMNTTYTASSIIYYIPEGYRPSSDGANINCLAVASPDHTANITQLHVRSNGQCIIGSNQAAGEFMIFGHYTAVQ